MMRYGIYNKTLKRWVKEPNGLQYVDIVRRGNRSANQALVEVKKDAESLSQHMYDQFEVKAYVL